MPDAFVIAFLPWVIGLAVYVVFKAIEELWHG